MLWDLPAVVVGGDRPLVFFPSGRITQVLDVITDGQRELVGHQPFFHQIQGQRVRHLPDDDPGLLRGVGAGEHLARAQAFDAGLVGADLRDGAGLPAPGVVDEQLGVDPEELVEQILVVVVGGFSNGAAGDIPHGVQPLGLQLSGVAPAHPPEVGERRVLPQEAAVAHLVQLRDPHPVLVRLYVLRHDVHGHLGEIQVGPDPRRGGDTGGVQHLPDHGHGQLMSRHAVGVQIVGQVHEHLVDGV